MHTQNLRLDSYMYVYVPFWKRLSLILVFFASYCLVSLHLSQPIGQPSQPLTTTQFNDIYYYQQRKKICLSFRACMSSIPRLNRAHKRVSYQLYTTKYMQIILQLNLNTIIKHLIHYLNSYIFTFF